MPENNRLPQTENAQTDSLWLRLPMWFRILFVLGCIGFVTGVLSVGGILYYFSRQVPDFQELANYQPSLITKIYARDGRIVSEYARERRIYVPIEDIPQPVIDSFLAAEDTHFYDHGGFDLKAIVRAALVNILTNRLQGASTITQQVAKTFLLSSERTYTRKIKELILSWRIERAFTKDEILELYLNQIYLGNGAYGIAAAAQSYFDKELHELGLGERALIAGLPKAPSRYNPVRHYQRAKQRRDIILRRMEVEGFITADQYEEEVQKALALSPKALQQSEVAPHFSELVRREVLDRYNSTTLYRGGLRIYTSLDLDMQVAAEESVYEGLRTYDRRHGWRGPLTNISLLTNWQERLKDEEQQRNAHRLVGRISVVLDIDDAAGIARIGFKNGEEGKVPFDTMKWARSYIDADRRGPKVSKVSDVLHEGDVVFVRRKGNDGLFALEQLPIVQGGLVALDVRTGAVRAMVGGTDSGTGFNRSVQAKRQAGSIFKPFVYTVAMESGMTPATVMLDAPVIFREEGKAGAWKPGNYNKKVYGPSTLRRGLENSRNLMTIRLAQEVGMSPIIRVARRFGLDAEQLDRGDLTIALGSGAFSLLDLTSAYSVFPNGGRRAQPYLIDRLQDPAGQTLFQKFSVCELCLPDGQTWKEAPYDVAIDSDRVLNEQVAYQMVSMLQGVVERGTGRRLKTLNRPMGGKTGTTNDYKDAWFIGFTPSLVVGAWVGFDTPATLGHGEAGGTVASPIVKSFMEDALKGPVEVFNVPEGITFVRIDQNTGKLPSAATEKTLLESFVKGTEPKVAADIPVNEKLPEEQELTPYGLF